MSPYSISFIEKAWRFSERHETGSGAWTKQKYKAMEIKLYKVLMTAGDVAMVFVARFGAVLTKEPGRVMLLDRLEWHGSPQLQLWPQVC